MTKNKELTFTKVLVTIGPSSESKEKIEELIDLGVRLFRLNFKHNTVEWHKSVASLIKQVAEQKKVKVLVVLDLQGPSVRLKLGQENLKIKKGDRLRFVDKFDDLKAQNICLNPAHLVKQLPNNARAYASDGGLSFFVEKQGNNVYLVSQEDGVLRNNVAFSVEDIHFKGLEVLTERDKEGLSLLKEDVIDLIALSFVSSAEDVKYVQDLASKIAGKHIGIISKIETKQGVKNIDEILDVSEAVMIARGDLALQTPFYKLVAYQKHLIIKAKEKGKPVIVATQMLESMTKNDFPTRAEISDVANAVLDKPDALMLSGETAIGHAPIKVVDTMLQIIRYYESSWLYNLCEAGRRLAPAPRPISAPRAGRGARTSTSYPTSSITTLDHTSTDDLTRMAQAASTWAQDYNSQDLRFIIVNANRMRSVDALTSLRPNKPIIVVTSNKQVADYALLRYAVAWSVYYKKSNNLNSQQFVQENLIKALAKIGHLKPGNRLLVLSENYIDKKAVYKLETIKV